MTNQTTAFDNIRGYAKSIIGKKFDVIQMPQVRVGDIVLNLNVMNVGLEKPLKVKNVRLMTQRVLSPDDMIYEVQFVGVNHLSHFAHSCIFGRLVN